MDTLQQQIRQLALQPDFIGQFLHEGAFLFPDEVTKEAHPVEQVLKAESTTELAKKELDSQPLSGKAAADNISTNKEDLKDTVEVKQTPAEPTALPLQPVWHDKVVVLLPPEPSIKEVQLLHRILAASGITDEQVYLQEKSHQARALGQFIGSRVVISFGAVTDFAPDYQLRSKTITVILAESLAKLEADVEAKKRLWLAMKAFFK